MPDDGRQTDGQGVNPDGDLQHGSNRAGSPAAWQQPPAWQQPYGGIWNSPPPTYWPGPYQAALAPWAPSFPIGSVPWGYTNPPPLLPLLEPPGKFHPPVSRPILSTSGRASPRLYRLGLVLGLPGIVALLLYMVGVRSGLTFAIGAIPAWVVVEAVSIVAAIGLTLSALAQARQRKADGWRDYCGPSPFLAGGALLALVETFGLPLELALKSFGVDLESAPATLILLLMYLCTYVAVVHFLSVRTGALTWPSIARPERLAPSADDWTAAGPVPDWTRRWSGTVGAWHSRTSGVRLGDILVPVAIVVPLILATNIMSALMLIVLGLQPSDIVAEGSTPMSGIDRLLALIALAVVAPIGEEIFFRGYATNAWGRSLSRNSTLLRASLFFAFIHVINVTTTDASVSWRAAVFNFGARVPVAFALTWLYMRRRSIVASGTLHVVYNGLITLLSFAA
jgi:membrane protease YdiL (CAAX protease family)